MTLTATLCLDYFVQTNRGNDEHFLGIYCDRDLSPQLEIVLHILLTAEWGYWHKKATKEFAHQEVASSNPTIGEQDQGFEFTSSS